MRAAAKRGYRSPEDAANLYRRRLAAWQAELEQRREAERRAAAHQAAAGDSRAEKRQAERFIRYHADAGEELPLRTAFRRAAMKLHPDRGGSRAEWDQLDQAARKLGLI